MSKVLVNDTSLTAIGNAIRSKNGTTNTYTPSQMAGAITALEVGGGSADPILESLAVTENGTYTPSSGVDGYNEVVVNVASSGGDDIPEKALNLTGNCTYWDGNGKWDWFVEEYGSRISTSNITNASNMFATSNLERIPFSINLSTGSNISISSIFYNSKLKEYPLITGLVSEFSKLTYGLQFIREYQMGSFDNVSTTITSFNESQSFYNNYSLLDMPDGYLEKLGSYNNTSTSAGNQLYYQFASSCFSLNEIKNLYVRNKTITSNMFSGFASYCTRIKRITFKTNDDGTPLTANWKSQTIDLSNQIGYYLYSSSYNFNKDESEINNSYRTILDKAINDTSIVKYNSGILAEDCIYNDYTFNLNKDNENAFYFCTLVNKGKLSRYNHDSAVETINSLPDTSAYIASAGGTNTIKFWGNSGADTGGAINTLTDSEIAVATSKGWTVTLV